MVCLVGKRGAGGACERAGQKKEEDEGKGGREGDHGEESGSGARWETRKERAVI